MSKRVRTLLRVSSRQQLHDDDIPVQRAEARQYIEKQTGWIFDKEYIEKAVSAYKNGVEEREILMEILQDAKRHEFDILLTYMSDRIGRKEEYSTYVATLNTLGIEVWTIKDGQLKTEEHIDKLLNFIRFWQNEGESKKTSARVRDAQQEMVKAGKFVGGKAPFGYRLVPSGEISNHGRLLKKLEIVEKDAEVVKKIYAYAIHQGMGYQRIARALNEEGIPPVSTDRWKASTIASILKNPVYMGYFAVNRRVNHGSFTRLDRADWIYSRHSNPDIVIISEEDWTRAQEIREERKNRLQASRQENLTERIGQYQTPFSTKGGLMLIGIAYCGYCGKALQNGSYCNKWTVKSTGEKKVSFVGRYRCPGKCRERSVYSGKVLESAVFQVVEGYLEDLKGIDVAEELRKKHVRHRAGIEKKLRAVGQEIRTLELDMETLKNKIPEAIRGDYCFSAERLSRLLNEKEESVRQKREEERRIKEKLQNAAFCDSKVAQCFALQPDWAQEFCGADKETKRMLLASMIERIEVRDGAVKIKFRLGREEFTGTPGVIDTHNDGVI